MKINKVEVVVHCWNYWRLLCMQLSSYCLFPPRGHVRDATVTVFFAEEDRQTVAEHLMQCDSCRREHDRIRLGAGLADGGVDRGDVARRG